MAICELEGHLSRRVSIGWEVLPVNLAEEIAMPWSRSKSQERISKFLETVPKSVVRVESFDDRYAREKDQRTMAAFNIAGPPRQSPIVHIPPSQSVLVDGVHVYVQLTDYHTVLTDSQRQTEARHRRALGFLHVHYSGCDRIIREYDAQRVDFHGPRLHAVIVRPPGPENERRRVERAIDFAQAIAKMVEISGEQSSNGEFKTGTRIGIDSGKAIAVNSGRSDEQEPLFLGSPANHAAKLADGEQPGIFLGDRARQVLGLHPMGPAPERSHPFSMRDAQLALPATFGAMRRTVDDARIRSMADEVKKALSPNIAAANFVFHRHQPPLRTIDYSALMPSNSIHMQMASIFADIDGFTNYVDTCIRDNRIPELVSNLHAIRLELAAVLKDDFNGRKVRFIGDCLHGVLAEGSVNETDDAKTVVQSVMCAAAIRSSFELCKVMLPGIDSLGIAIGVELGPTPITRLGLRGDGSVRCATSKAVSQSEVLQAKCDGEETALGEIALAAAPISIRRAFQPDGVMAGLDWNAAVAHFIPAPAVPAGSRVPAPGPHLEG